MRAELKKLERKMQRVRAMGAAMDRLRLERSGGPAELEHVIDMVEVAPGTFARNPDARRTPNPSRVSLGVIFDQLAGAVRGKGDY